MNGLELVWGVDPQIWKSVVFVSDQTENWVWLVGTRTTDLNLSLSLWLCLVVKCQGCDKCPVVTEQTWIGSQLASSWLGVSSWDGARPRGTQLLALDAPSCRNHTNLSFYQQSPLQYDRLHSRGQRMEISIYARLCTYITHSGLQFFLPTFIYKIFSVHTICMYTNNRQT